MDVDALVVREGDCATATGRLVRDETGDWFEPFYYAGFRGGGPRRVWAARRAAVRVIGADFDDLTNRFEDHGAVEGFATVIGICAGSSGTWSGWARRAATMDRPR